MGVVYHAPMSISSVFGLFSELGTELLILSVSALAWAAFGRDHRTRFVPERRDPPEAPVAIALMCVDGGSVSLLAIAATVADLAERGALRVAAEDRGGRTAWTFDVVPGASFSSAEAALVEALGHGSGSKGFRRQVAMDASAEGWFRADPTHVRGAYAVVALLVAVWLFFRAGDTGRGLLSVFGTALVVLLFGWAMPRRTAKGDALVAQARGFRETLRESAGRLPPAAWPWAFAFGLEAEMRAAHGPPAWLSLDGADEKTAVDGFVAAVAEVLGDGA